MKEEKPFMKKKKIIGLLSGICLIGIVISGLLIIRSVKRAGAEEVTEGFLHQLRSDKTVIVKNYLEEQGIEAEVLWTSLAVRNNNAYILYEYKPDEAYVKERYPSLEGAPGDYDYLGYLKLERTFNEGAIEYYKVAESKETFASEKTALSEGLYGFSGWDSGAEDFEYDWYDWGGFIWFLKVYTDEVEKIEFYDDALLKATYHVGDKGYIFIVLQDVSNVTARLYDKEHNLIGEKAYYTEYDTTDLLQDYSNIEKGRVDEWKNGR